MVIPPYVAKVIGATILFSVTLIFTLLPGKLKGIGERTLKSISCFCGGLFLGLCFLHLIPDCLRAFREVESLNKIQQSYPMAEFTICVGMIIVMTAERLADVLQQKHREKRKCDASKDCCKVKCRKDASDEKTPLIESYQSSYSVSDDSVTIDTVQFDHEQNNSILIVGNKSIQDSLKTDNEQKSINQSLKSTKSNLERNKQRMRTLCLVISLMVHSLFEGLTVGLQSSLLGLVTLVSLLAFHKCIIGFSLGINIINSKRNFSYHLKHAVVFAVASPIGILVGIIILSSKLNMFNDEAVTLLTAIATGTFLFITFFEILAKDLTGNTIRDLVNFACCLVGFAGFAGITCIKATQT